MNIEQYAWFVWTAYGIVAVGLAGVGIWLFLGARRERKLSEKLQKKN